MKVGTGVLIWPNHKSRILLVFVPSSVSHFLAISFEFSVDVSNNSSYIVRLDMGRAHIAGRRYLNGPVCWFASLPFAQSESTHITNPQFLAFEKLSTPLATS